MSLNPFGLLALSAIALLFLQGAHCDLPIHCLKHEVEGIWEFTVAPAKEEKLLDNLCHHNVPGNPEYEWTATQDKLPYSDEATTVEIELNANYDAVVQDEDIEDPQNGRWTLIYDEGMEVRIPGASFFVFFSYRPWEYSDGYTNDCDKTLLGWYFNTETEMYGCFYANMIEKTTKPGDSLIQTLKKQSTEAIKSNNHHLTASNNLQKIDSSFKDHEELTRRINSASLSWRATTYNQHKESTFGEMEDFLTSRKTPDLTRSSSASSAKGNHSNQARLVANQHSPFLPKTSSMTQHKSQGTSRLSSKASSTSTSHKEQEIASDTPIVQDNDDLPSEFLKWKKYISKAENQRSCGSCYAFSTIEMLEARLRIKYGKDKEVLISKQDALSCSIYSQACAGGFTTELTRFGHEVGFVMNIEQPYDDAAEAINCIYDDPATQVDKYVKISEYGLVGGGYGNCDERAMMIEIMENGPVTCAMDATTDLYYYEDGIYEPVDISVWMDMGYEKPEFESVTHGLLCWGWGEEDGEKFWWVMNSWGSDWGINGNFKMKRGGDVSAIESFAEWGDPYIIEDGEEWEATFSDA